MFDNDVREYIKTSNNHSKPKWNKFKIEVGQGKCAEEIMVLDLHSGGIIDRVLKSNCEFNSMDFDADKL